MKQHTRITFGPAAMGGKPCIRALRVAVGMIVGLLTTEHTKDDILKSYPNREPVDIDQTMVCEA